MCTRQSPLMRTQGERTAERRSLSTASSTDSSPREVHLQAESMRRKMMDAAVASSVVGERSISERMRPDEKSLEAQSSAGSTTLADPESRAKIRG